MNEMSYCREVLRELSGDGPVMVKSLTARKQHEDSMETAPKQGTYRTGIQCRANGRRTIS